MRPKATLTHLHGFCLIALVAMGLSCSGNDNDEEKDKVIVQPIEFKNFNERISYCIGMDQGKSTFDVYNGPRTKGKFDNEQILAGMTDYLNDKPLRISMEMVDSILNQYLQPGGNVDDSVVTKEDGSYAIGLTEAQYLVGSMASKGIDQDIDVWFLIEGIKDGMKSVESTMKFFEARTEVSNYYNEINRDQGRLFLENNGRRDSVTRTASGLQYQIIEEGNGKTPNLTDSVSVHYTGYFIDGRAFESTIPSGVPASFALVRLIPGWQEGLTLMKERSKFRFYIPFDLAYGESGSGPIPPFSALVFDIELLEVIRYS